MIKCDYCEKPAVRNYQKVWVSWVIIGNGYSKEPKFEGMRIEEPTGEDNIHVCREHEKLFLEGKI